MMNSLLYCQAYLCWSIINDFLAWLKKLLISYQVFEKRKNKNIANSSLLVSDKRQSKNSKSTMKNRTLNRIPRSDALPLSHKLSTMG